MTSVVPFHNPNKASSAELLAAILRELSEPDAWKPGTAPSTLYHEPWAVLELTVVDAVVQVTGLDGQKIEITRVFDVYVVVADVQQIGRHDHGRTGSHTGSVDVWSRDEVDLPGAGACECRISVAPIDAEGPDINALDTARLAEGVVIALRNGWRP